MAYMGSDSSETVSTYLCTPAARPAPFRGSLFSVGGLVARWAQAQDSRMPWIVAALCLGALSASDLVMRGGRIDFILAGLAAYELLIGLTEDSVTA